MRYKKAWEWVWLMASDGCLQPEPGIPPKHQDKASDKLPIPAPAKGSAPAGSAGAKETAKEAANFHSLGLLSVYPHPSPLPGQSSAPSPLPNPQRMTQAFCRKDPAPWPAWPPGTVTILASKATARLVHTHTNVHEHLLLMALTNKEDGYGNEEWSRWFLGGHTLLPFLSLTFQDTNDTDYLWSTSKMLNQPKTQKVFLLKFFILVILLTKYTPQIPTLCGSLLGWSNSYCHMLWALNQAFFWNWKLCLFSRWHQWTTNDLI